MIKKLLNLFNRRKEFRRSHLHFQWITKDEARWLKRGLCPDCTESLSNIFPMFTLSLLEKCGNCGAEFLDLSLSGETSIRTKYSIKYPPLKGQRFKKYGVFLVTSKESGPECEKI